MLSPNTIKPAKGSKHTVKRVGRGNSSGKGTYSARGGKGQTARSGTRRTAIRAFKASLQKVPKLRGFSSLINKKETVSLKVLAEKIKDGEVINPRYLKTLGLIGKPANGVKLVAGKEEFNKKVTFQGCLASKKAIEMIEKAGGKIMF
jgi:large subunit ribosomal protein L15